MTIRQSPCWGKSLGLSSSNVNPIMFRHFIFINLSVPNIVGDAVEAGGAFLAERTLTSLSSWENSMYVCVT